MRSLFRIIAIVALSIGFCGLAYAQTSKPGDTPPAASEEKLDIPSQSSNQDLKSYESEKPHGDLKSYDDKSQHKELKSYDKEKRVDDKASLNKSYDAEEIVEEDSSDDKSYDKEK